jgi:glycosyltransferase involved in cell wall biosynthesis
MSQARSVAVVIPCFDQAHFLAAAIESALAQWIKPAEVIVVDDGSTGHLAEVVDNYASVTLIRQYNRGLAAARNTGLAAATADKIVFLDADDRLLPTAVESGLRCFADNPDAAFVYGGYRLVEGKRESDKFRLATTRCDLIQCNSIGMAGTVMFDRLKLAEIGGFDEELGMCEDWDAYLRLTRRHGFAAHPDIVARYVWHGGNMSADRRRLKKWIEVVRQKERERGLTVEEERSWQEGREIVAAAYAGPLPRLAKRIGLVRRPRAR